MITSYKPAVRYVTVPSPNDIDYHELIDLQVVYFGQIEEISKQDFPCANQYFEILYLTSGSCTCKADFEEYEVNEHNFGFIRPGQIHQILWSNDACGYILRFTTEFLQTSVEKSIFFNQTTFTRFSGLSKIKIDIFLKSDLNQIFEKMKREFDALLNFKHETFRLEIISGLLKVILVSISGIIISQQNRDPETSCVTNRFFLLLEKKYKTYKTANEYADELAVTRGYLNESLKKKAGFTTTYFIQQRIITEAKRLTIYSDITLKEIAFRLGFEDLSHFSKFFKKATGSTFTEYKKKALAVM